MDMHPFSRRKQKDGRRQRQDAWVLSAWMTISCMEDKMTDWPKSRFGQSRTYTTCTSSFTANAIAK
eukprot:1159061-Pelagomonas_calceolata.AAC.19